MKREVSEKGEREREREREKYMKIKEVRNEEKRKEYFIS